MAIKTVTGVQLFADNEATYGAGAALTGSQDAIQIAVDYPTFQYQFGYDGNRNGAQGSGGNLRRTSPAVRSTQGTVRIEGKGLGSAYTATATPPNLHAFIQASGFSGSMQGATWVYKPVDITTTAPVSLAAIVYAKGESLSISGAYCNMKFSAEGASPTIFEFDVQGTCATIADVSPAARLYSGSTVLPPKNEAIQFTVGAVSSFKVRSYEYNHNLTIAPRVDQNTSGSHGGYAVGRRDPEFKVVVEADALSTFNPYDDWNLGTTRAVSFTVGTTAFNRFAVSFPQATLSSVEQQADGPTATWALTYKPWTSLPDASDDVTITFN